MRNPREIRERRQQIRRQSGNEDYVQLSIAYGFGFRGFPGRGSETPDLPSDRVMQNDIIASTAATNRVKDRESLPRLRSFRDYWVRKQS